MAQAKTINTTTADTSRRRFMAFTAAASAVAAGSLAVAAMPAAQDDRKLIELEEKIFEQWWGARAFDSEIMRLAKIWQDDGRRLYEASLSADGMTSSLSPQERWELVTNMPACVEHDRLCDLQEPFLWKLDALIDEMFAMPAHTADGRRAKVQVLLTCMLGADFNSVDEKTDRPQLLARNLLIEFIGGEPGAMLRDQFA